MGGRRAGAVAMSEWSELAVKAVNKPARSGLGRRPGFSSAREKTRVTSAGTGREVSDPGVNGLGKEPVSAQLSTRPTSWMAWVSAAAGVGAAGVGAAARSKPASLSKASSVPSPSRVSRERPS